MSNSSGFYGDNLGAAVDGFSQDAIAKIVAEMTNVVQEIFDASQADVPVAAENGGALRDSGGVQVDESSLTFSVTYGDGNGTDKQYSYPGYDDPADGYAWFQELGTTNMAAQPYLGPHFDEQALNIESRLNGLFE